MQFTDKTLTCRECHKPFLWTAGEQAFFKERGLINIPARCVECRSNRKEKMGLQRQTVTEVVCADCGQKTTVPFVPRNGKPIYCSPCLAKAREREEAEKAAALESAS
jgi:CxxC-x17-CxxC domain-containing protein